MLYDPKLPRPWFGPKAVLCPNALFQIALSPAPGLPAPIPARKKKPESRARYLGPVPATPLIYAKNDGDIFLSVEGTNLLRENGTRATQLAGIEPLI